MNNYRFIRTLLAAVLLFSACGRSEGPIPPTHIEVEVPVTVVDSALAATGDVTELMVNKAIDFRNKTGVGDDIAEAVAAGKYAGVYVYSRSVNAYASDPGKLAARLALLGFTDVYLSTTNAALNGSDASKRAWLRSFNAAMTGYGARVHALRFSNTKAYVSDATVYADAEAISAFNASTTDPAQKFYGASADYEPHILKAGGADTPAGLTTFWNSTSGYGIGNANDILLEKTEEILALAATEVGTLPLSEAISYLYQPRFAAGELSHGGVVDFLAHCDHVMVMAYNYRMNTIWNRVNPVLVGAAGYPKSVALCVKVSLNTYGDSGEATTSLQPQGWTYLLSALEYFAGQGANSEPYKGVCFFEFDGLEQMWSWSSDKGPN